MAWEENSRICLHMQLIAILSRIGVFASNNIDVKWKETRYALPEGTTVPSRVLDTLHTKYPDFTYTEVFVIENQCGISYLFTDGTRADRLGHYIEAN